MSAELDELPGFLRVPHYESADKSPNVSRLLWWRLLQLLIKRGDHLHPCAARMARHAAVEADERGRIDDINVFLGKYAAKHLVSVRTGWIDLERLLQAGWMRQTQTPCPERNARYRLTADLAAVPDDLPKTLADEVRRHIDNPITIAKGGQTKAAIDEGLAGCEMVRYGSATRGGGVPREPIMTALGCGRLHTSPYTREGLPPPLPSHPSQEKRPPHRRAFGGRDFGEERAAALYFVQGLRPDWARQRGGEVPTDAELAELAHLVMLLLRHVPRSEARELLTAQVGSAGDLCGVLRWRTGRALGKLRRASRRAAALPVDDDGARHAAWLAANAERNAANAPRRAELVELAERLRQQAAEPRFAAEQARLDARLASADASRPSAAPSAPQPPSQGRRSDPAENGDLDRPRRRGRRDVLIVAPPVIAVDDDGRRHAALLADNEAANAANAVRRAELIERARAIAAARTADTAQPPAGPGPATVVRAPLHNRLTGLLAKHDDGPHSPPSGAPSPARPVEQQQARATETTRATDATDVPVQPQRTLQDRLADLLARRSKRS
ncbi:hypothetical protein [Nonomuraea sp. B5E05]|uniref:hypothetical protein n=1 Tax=Nonomuraea sp. B5E05 TaxID=3153569 RepID=UPI0032607227